MACNTCPPNRRRYPDMRQGLDPATMERMRSYAQEREFSRPVTRPQYERPKPQQHVYTRSVPRSLDYRERDTRKVRGKVNGGFAPTMTDEGRIVPSRQQNYGGDFSMLPTERRPVYKSNRKLSWDNVFF